MAKKKTRRIVQGFGSDTQGLKAGLAKADMHLVREEWSKAKAKLEELELRYPKNPQVLAAFSYLYYQIKDFENYQEVLERLTEYDPDNVDAILSLAAAYLENVRPLLAMQTFRQFLSKFPNHEQAADVRQTLAEFEEKLDYILADLTLEGDNAEEIGILHEEMLCKLQQDKYEQACKIGEKILELRPNFTPALNNMSLALEYDGNRQQAIATAQRVLEINPHNFHAHANLTRFYLLEGNETAAREQAGQIQAEDPNILDFRAKKAEALAYLEDYQGIAAIIAEVKTAGQLDDAQPLLLHLGAVAEMRLGKEKEARKLWQQALKNSPDFTLAKKNLEDLKLPLAERNAPWAFDLQYWISQKAINDLVEITEDNQRQKLADSQIGERYLKKHPQMIRLIPILLRQGGPIGREFAFKFAKMTKTPELVEALRDFALSDRGPDSLRLEASQVASEAGLIPYGEIQFWSNGKWQEVLLMGMEISDEPSYRHSKAVDKIEQEAIAALKAKQGEKGEALLLKALELEPDAPDLSYNLAGAYQVQGRSDEAQELIKQIFQKHPDYPFARISLAKLHINNKELDEAEAILKPMLQWKKFHFSAFCKFCETQIELCLAQKKPEGARSWLGMWENVDPEDPDLSHWKKRLQKKSFWPL